MTDGNAPGVTDDEHTLKVVNAIVHLWLAVEVLTEVGEDFEANHIHLPMERLCLKYDLPLAEAETYADQRKLN